MSNVEYI